MNKAMTKDARRTILVVEDDPLVAAMICDALDYAGMEAISVAAGEDALSLAVMDTPFDLVLTDIELAGPLDGWELAEALREMRPGMRLIYTSAHAGAEGHARVPDSRFVAKPYSPLAVCATIRELLQPSDCKPDIAPRPAAPQPAVIQLDDRRALRA